MSGLLAQAGRSVPGRLLPLVSARRSYLTTAVIGNRSGDDLPYLFAYSGSDVESGSYDPNFGIHGGFGILISNTYAKLRLGITPNELLAVLVPQITTDVTQKP